VGDGQDGAVRAASPYYLPEELDAECERVILSFLNKKYGNIEFPIKTDDLTVFIEEQADLDSYADLSGEGDHVEGVTEFQSGKRPVVRIAEALNASHLENRLRTTLTHEYGHVHFHRFMFEDLQGKSPSLFGHADEAQGNKCHRDHMLNAPERDWMEWQAGYACLCGTYSLLSREMRPTFGTRGRCVGLVLRVNQERGH
jgi:hypothetical protein